MLHFQRYHLGSAQKGAGVEEKLPQKTKNILPQSTGEFDPEGNPELKKPPDPSQTSIGRNFRKLLSFDPDKNYGKKIYKEMIRSLQLLILNEISLIRRKNVGLPDDLR